MGNVSVEEYARRGKLKFLNGKYDKALLNYDKALNLTNSNADIYVFRGMTYARINNHKRALSDYAKAIKICKDNLVLPALSWVANGEVI